MKAHHLIGIGLSILLTAATAFGHSGQITQCNAKLTAKLVGAEMVQNGMYAEYYDTNSDGKPDVVTWSQVRAAVPIQSGDVNIEHDQYATFFLVDIDFDGETDKVYIDKAGTGQCEDIVLYEDLLTPGKHGLPKNGGLVGL